MEHQSRQNPGAPASQEEGKKPRLEAAEDRLGLGRGGGGRCWGNTAGRKSFFGLLKSRYSMAN